MDLLEYLLKRFPDYKKTKLKQLLKHGSIAVNGRATTAYDRPIHPEDRVELLDRKSSHLPFTIVYEDAWLVVVDKPAGLLTIGTDTDKINTLYYALTDYVRGRSKRGRCRVFIVHRLDRESSGLLVFAKEESVKRALQDHWAEVTKKYYAVVEGTPKKSRDTLESFLVEDKFRRIYSAPRLSGEGKRALMRYEIVKSNARYSLLDVALITGRKNQIRVQLSDLGHPIVGDQKYGSHADPAGRLALHAYFLSFRHPETQTLQTFETPLPASLKLV